MSDEFPRPDDGPSVEMPKPTVWPIVLGLGIAVLCAGVVIGPGFLVLGGLLVMAALIGWISDLLPGRGHAEEPLSAPTPDRVVATPGKVEHSHPGMPGYRFRLPREVRPISAGVKGGIAGGLVMPLPAFAWALLSGHTIWFPVNLLAGMLLPGIGAMTEAELERFSPVLLAIGIVIHTSMSLVIGLLSGVLSPTLPSRAGWQLVAGGVVVPVLWSGLSYSLMGVVNPALQAHVDWLWFVASQLVFGLVMWAVVLRSERVAVAPAGGP
jgi:hypothetical protein